VAALTTDQVANLQTADLVALSTTQFHALGTDQVAALTTTEVAALTTADFAAITTTQFHAFATDAVAAMTTADVHALTTAVVHSMSTDQVAALTTAEIQAFTTAHVAALTTDHIVALTTTEAAAFTSAEFAALSTAHIAAFTTDQLAHLTTTEIGAFTTAQMHVLTTDQIAAFVTDTIQAFTTTDLHSLTSTQANAFSNDIPSMTDAQVNALITADPIVLDLSGAGIHTSNVNTQGVNFDITGTGKVDTVGWTTGNEGFLVLDKNHDGLVNSGAEMFGTGMLMGDGTRAASGYQALSQYDTNHDGVINANDAVFKQLQVWVDANHDGKVEAGEMKSLHDLGIVSLDLHAQAGNTADNGNSIGLTSTYTTASGATHQMADVNLTKADTATPATDPSIVPAGAAAAPHLSELLAAPSTDLLPGHVDNAAVASTAGHASTAQVHGMLDQRLLEEEERHRLNNSNPLI
jgi:hypothetical protein